MSGQYSQPEIQFLLVQMLSPNCKKAAFIAQPIMELHGHWQVEHRLSASMLFWIIIMEHSLPEAIREFIARPITELIGYFPAMELLIQSFRLVQTVIGSLPEQKKDSIPLPITVHRGA